ncbi:YopT-type cysteine protease domain-containing protein [Pseudomonas sp. NPDC089554]|uniref:YopT-type cysteine protease domain-containing protein n=1 Tax=Pseudomonas sp. NPDC089554 TaxID=3390653 RepID=UPI003D0428FD
MDRAAKFKQRTHVENNALDRESGVCAGAALMWLKQLLEQPAESPEQRIASISDSERWFEMKRMHGEFNTVRHGTYMDRLRIGIPNVCMRQTGREKTATGRQGVEELVTFIDETQPSHYAMDFSFDVPAGMNEDDVSTHTCAFYVANNRMRFFDPNFGEFEVNGNIKSFLLKLHEQYRTYVSRKGVRVDLVIAEMRLIQVAR